MRRPLRSFGCFTRRCLHEARCDDVVADSRSRDCDRVSCVCSSRIRTRIGPVCKRSRRRNERGARGPAPRMTDGHPDLSGVWWPGRDLNPQTSTTQYAPGRDEGTSIVGRDSFGSLYQPWAMAKAKTLSDKDDPALHCIPSLMGPPPLAGNGLVGQIVQTPKFVILLIETFHGFRIVPTDGRAHRDDVLPSYLGDSVGSWKGRRCRRHHELQRQELGPPPWRCELSL